MNSESMKLSIQKVIEKIQATSAEELKKSFEEFRPTDLSEAIMHSGFFEGNEILGKVMPQQPEVAFHPFEVSVFFKEDVYFNVTPSFFHLPKIPYRYLATQTIADFTGREPPADQDISKKEKAPILINDGVEKWAA